MGAIVSAIAVAISSLKKSRDKKKAKKNAQSFGAQDPQQSYSQTQDVAVEGLRDEHLSSAPPPVAPSSIVPPLVESEVEKNVAVQAPLPVSTTATTGFASQGENISATLDEMASDGDYASFLDKANEDPGAGVAKSGSSKVQLKALDTGVDVPDGLKTATKDAFYVSDADEPFEPVVLKHAGKSLPTEAAFAKLVNHPSPMDADVDILDIGAWDPQGQYKELVDAVRKETKGCDVMVYRIVRDGSRVEYWLLGLEGGKLLGVKALAVES